MRHFYLEIAALLFCLFACILGFIKHHKPAGFVFLYSSIGILFIALERALPGTSLWLGDTGAGVILLGSAWYAVSIWRARQNNITSDASRTRSPAQVTSSKRKA